MSFIDCNSHVEFRKKVPSVRAQTDGSPGVVVTYTITPPIVPLEGSLLWIAVGGSANRTIVTPPAGGWTQYARLGGTLNTMFNWYKYATASEPANWTVTFNSSLAGAWIYAELLDTDITLASRNGTGSTGAASLPMPPYGILCPGIMTTTLAKNQSEVWTADNGCTNYTTPGTIKMATKIFSAPLVGTDIVTWSGVLQGVVADWFTFRGKPIF